MTHGETLYLILVLATFASFAIGVGTASLRQTRLDTAARRAVARVPQAMQPAE